MENITNRSDIYNFFKDMPEHMQQEVINKLNKQIKKPPDYSNPSMEIMNSDIEEFEERK